MMKWRWMVPEYMRSDLALPDEKALLFVVVTAWQQQLGVAAEEEQQGR